MNHPLVPEAISLLKMQKDKNIKWIQSILKALSQLHADNRAIVLITKLVEEMKYNQGLSFL